MLKVNKLSIQYGDKKVVSDLDIELGKDEIMMLVGPTGCGKTTILKSLAGLIPISDGEIALPKWCATAKNHIAPEKRNVGMVFQDFALFPHLTVEENIGFRLKELTQVNRWINILGLETIRRAKPHQLSGGQKQRVALARTLAHEPDFILLDEPLSNLDAALKDDLRWEIRNALKAAAIPAIWVTHDQEEALSVGDRVGILKHGVLEQLDTPEICYSQPNNKFVARFLGEASFVTGECNRDVQRVATSIGDAAYYPTEADQNEVDVLLRPDDLTIVHDDIGNGQVEWMRYEGSARLYSVIMDNGETIKVRSHHENKIDINERVSVRIFTQHPLQIFAHN
ncbi:ABC transporter ATP-binding protein [Bermanella marisrubri]|uniref:Putative ABC-type transport system, ATPase component n=1 Tax=Bermanella marisrubri TaxID=207949 RepID=Q1N2E1_9GAMM|nr:ABC transporter ATP-binding protein [Bermanella marisrubri]EAT12466.1 putative ABC-type transport system, ATPase component [Oceanobacter sp. RED65] [Bermanella marisrubri]QIZ85544.1 ABC transporter ATP-binding protein [Bermanella marisrubri]